MKKKITAFTITLFIFITICTVIYQMFTYNVKQTPKAEDGYLDLTKWNFSKDGPVPMNGEWNFYPNKLLNQVTFTNPNKLTPEKINVPGNWFSKMHSPGVATYSLHIKVKQADRVFGLKTSSIQLANRIIVNGTTIGRSGNPSREKNYIARNKPNTSYFNLHSGWNDIVIQVANYDLNGSGGINGPIYFGYAPQILNLQEKALSYDWIIVASFVIIGLYFMGLYSQRKYDYSLIIFGLFCFFIAVYTSTSGERVFFNLFESAPFWLYFRTQILSIVGLGIGLYLYVYTAFRPYCSKRIVQIGLGLGLVLLVIVVGIVKYLNMSILSPILTSYIMISFLYATYIFLLAALHKIAESLFLVIAAISMIAYILIQSVSVYFAVPIYKTSPYIPLIFLLMLSLLMSSRFANAYRKIQELSIRLLQTDKLKDEFLVRTSHEFKSPLHGIINISRTIVNDTAQPLNPEHREKLLLITNISNRLSQLVYDILDLSKLKQGELMINPEPIDVRSVVDVLLRFYQFTAIDRNIQLRNQIPEHLAYALADESRLGQIMSNLLDNAIKHTKNGNVEVFATEHNNRIEISVRDTGVGIAEEDIPYIFEPFHSQGDLTDNNGVGLGLAIVQQLVELQNGEITVSSIKNQGTTFTFTLPKANSREIKRTHYQLIDDINREREYTFPTPYYLDQEGKYTVLIADDNFPNLKILIDVLKSINCNVIAVQNGYEVMEQFDKPNVIDLVILDLRMPGMSGYEICQALREKYTLTDLPVLMVTAAIEPKDKVATFKAGANDFLPKPFDLSELKARIRSLLEMKESFRKALDLEMAFLQSQIKPHFIYNALNSIVATSYTNADKSRKLTLDLADYLRGSFQFSNLQKRVPFAQELKLMKTYIEIEKARFRDRIQIDYHIDKRFNNLCIPPLLIQPLVENAVHGIGLKPEGGKVEVTAYVKDSYYIINIDDNGIGMSEKQLRELAELSDSNKGVGIKNISKRLKYEYGTELEIQSEKGKGTSITVRIPLQ
ncbi:hybrid sensor histidine kinase/response regulator [Terrilactibacillus laevilacticus]|uniref:hybrid sensor histidine kinase/response regulator n=1 Tax=Terrilactibacillus laevilacticus TaxID=1380157 RepID=UPI001146C2AD|nr:ATP-binding protein [Terrilactibacillus laevilacticus]